MATKKKKPASDPFATGIDFGTPPSLGSTAKKSGPSAIGNPDTAPFPASPSVDLNAVATIFGVPYQGPNYQPVDVQEIYTNGDEWGNVIGFPTDPQGVAELQNYLINAGYLSPKAKILFGQWDQLSATAFKKLLSTANASRTDWQSALATRLSAAEQGLIAGLGPNAPSTKKAPRAEQPPLTVTLDNPEDIKAVIKEVSQKLYSGALSPEQQDLFVTLVQAAQADFQKQQYSQQYNTVDYSRDPESESNYYGPGGTLTAPPTGAGLSNLAEQFVRNAKPEQVFASTFGQAMAQAVPSLLKPGMGLM